jgi:hypothetical protein
MFCRSCAVAESGRRIKSAANKIRFMVCLPIILVIGIAPAA